MYRDLKNKNIILTGGTGFLGQQIVDAFRTLGSNVIVLDIIKPKNSDNIEFYKCDITKENEVKKVSLKIIKK